MKVLSDRIDIKIMNFLEEKWPVYQEVIYFCPEVYVKLVAILKIPKRFHHPYQENCGKFKEVLKASEYVEVFLLNLGKY